VRIGIEEPIGQAPSCIAIPHVSRNPILQRPQTGAAATPGHAIVPRVLGVLLMVSGVTWLGANLAVIVQPAVGGALMWSVGVAALGEILFTAWLLLRGVDVAEWRRQSSELSS